MKPLLHILLSLIILSSCMISTDVVYNDPNYLKSTEFKEYNEIISERNQVIDNDSIVQSENYESEDGYYYHDYSSRIKRFHRPLFYSDYYSGFYTGYNYHNYDPYWDFNYPYYNSSIYFGYQFNPYSYGYYHNPYYYGMYHGYHWNHHYPHYTLYNKKSFDQYTRGKRYSLQSKHNNNRLYRSKNIVKSKEYISNKNSAPVRNRSLGNKQYQYNSSRDKQIQKNRGNNRQSYIPEKDNNQNNFRGNRSRSYNNKSNNINRRPRKK